MNIISLEVVVVCVFIVATSVCICIGLMSKFGSIPNDEGLHDEISINGLEEDGSQELDRSTRRESIDQILYDWESRLSQQQQR